MSVYKKEKRKKKCVCVVREGGPLYTEGNNGRWEGHRETCVGGWVCVSACARTWWHCRVCVVRDWRVILTGYKCSSAGPIVLEIGLE